MAEEQQEYYTQETDANGQSYQQEEYPTQDDGSGYAGGAGGDGGGGAIEPDDDDKKLFVGGLNWDTSEQELRNYMAKYGEVATCTLKTDQETNRSRGFGFVVFKESSSCEKVLEQTTHKLHGRNIDPKRANPKKREPNLKVFVGGLNTDTPEASLREHFQKFGKIAEIDLPLDQSGQRRRFCFIKFETEDVVRKVIEERMQFIGGKEVEVKKSVPKRGGFGGGWDQGGGRGGRGGGGRGGRGGYQGGWNQGGYGNQGYGGYGGYNQGYGGYNQGGYGSYGAYDGTNYYGAYNQGYGNGGWGGYDQNYTGYDYTAWGGYSQDGGEAAAQTSGYGKAPKRGGSTGYQPY